MSGIEWLFGRVLQASWQASLVIALVALAQRALGRRLTARGRAALWLLVPIRLLLPLGPNAEWSLFNYTDPRAAVSRVQSWIRPPAAAEREVGLGDGKEGRGWASSARAGAGMPRHRAASSPSGWVWSDLGRALLRWGPGLWLAGCAALGLRLVWQNAWFGRQLRRCPAVSGPDVLELLAGCRRLVGVRAPLQVVETDLVRSPALYGLLRGRLLLPTGLLGRLTPEQQRCVFLHELTHLKRWDPITGWVLSVLRVVHWFNPLVWFAFRRVRRDRELACDESVLALTQGRDKEVYGETIIRLLELGLKPARLPALIGIVENTRQIERRIGLIAGFRLRPSRSLVGILVFAGLALVTLTDARTDAEADRPAPQTVAEPEPGQTAPRVVSTSPAVGATDVDPALTDIRVTFDRDMTSGVSWTGGGPDFPPSPEGREIHWLDRRTCVLPVLLEAAHYYRVGVNSTSFQNFRSVEGVAANPSVICFTTQGAGEALKLKVIPPQAVRFDPPNGAQDIHPGLTELRVTFDVAMGDGFSWTGGGPRYPGRPEGQPPYWTEDGKTCVLPVILQPDRGYRLGLNSRTAINFQSAAGVPLNPVIYTFTTRKE